MISDLSHGENERFTMENEQENEEEDNNIMSIIIFIVSREI